MFLPSLYLLLKSLCGPQVGINMWTYLHCIYCKVKTRIQGEKCHTLRSRCACVWKIFMVANVILLCSLKHISLVWNLKILCKKTWAILFIFLLFLDGHLSTHCFRYLGHLSIFSYLFFLFSFFMNNFCIALCLFSATKLWEIATRTWSIYLVDEKPIKHILYSLLV